MKNLEKVEKVWTNLEDSYAKYKKTHRSVNRVDYLKKLLAWDVNGANITGVRNLLHDEVDSYDAEEAAEYTDLFDMLNKTAECLENYSGEIEDLDSWIGLTVLSGLNDSTSNYKSFKVEDFSLLCGHAVQEARDILAAGYFCNTVVLDKNGEIHSYEFNKEDRFYRFFHSQNDAVSFFTQYKDTGSKFLEKVRDIIAYRVINKLRLDNCAYISGEIYAITSKTAYVGNVKFAISKQNHVASDLKFKGVEGKITSVDYYEIEHDDLTLILVRK